MKRKLLTLALVAILAISAVGCGGNGTSDSGGSSFVSQEENQTSEPMSEDAYLTEVEGLSAAEEDFLMAYLNALSDDVDVKTRIERVRVTKDPFIAFSEITNPPQGYEEVHSRLAEASGRYGDFIDSYADLLWDTSEGLIRDREYDKVMEKLTAEQEEITSEIEKARAEIEAAQ